MTDEKTPIEQVLEKLDALNTRIESLETPPEEEQKEDADPRIEKAASAIRLTLKGSFPDEKLDAMTLDELLMATSLKADFTPPVGINPPTGGGKQKEDAYNNVPENMKAHYGSETNYGGLIQ